MDVVDAVAAVDAVVDAVAATAVVRVDGPPLAVAPLVVVVPLLLTPLGTAVEFTPSVIEAMRPPL